MPRLASTLAALVFLGLGLSAAQAHKLKVFATAVGNDVEGYAYFSPGGRAQDAAVTVTLPDGTVVQTLKTNDEGEFHFTAKQRARHTILVDAGDGHEATYHVPAEELGTIAASTPLPAAQTADAPQPTATPARPDGQVAALVDQAVARQLRPLREEINAWQEKIWLHDVLGGLGYIIGLGGLVYGLTGNRRGREREDASRRLKEARQ